MSDRDQHFRELRERQENTLPLNIAANEGLFLGRLLRGGTFTPVQRIGAVIIALPLVAIGVLGVPLGIHDVMSESSWGMRVENSLVVIVYGIFGLLGLRVVRNVLRQKRM